MCVLTDPGADYCVWTRGAKDDYNRLAKISGDAGWGWNSLLPYFKKVRLRAFLPFLFLSHLC